MLGLTNWLTFPAQYIGFDKLDKKIGRDEMVFKHTVKAMKSSLNSINSINSVNSIYSLNSVNSAQCALWAVRWPCSILAIAVKTLSHGKTIFLRLFFLYSFRKKT